MHIEYFESLTLHDYEPVADSFREEVLEGLRQKPKRIPSKFFYDDRGSKLFRQITTLEEYYPTRTELGIMRDSLPAIAAVIGEHAEIVEFGSGASLKTKQLLKALRHPSAYIPIDISREQLLESSFELAEMFPDVEVWPVCTDYTEPFDLPVPETPARSSVVFYPGSTIGNFTPEEAVQFLTRARRMIRREGSLEGAAVRENYGLLIGVDQVKDTAILERAYNDRKGVTAAFNKNLLYRFGLEFELDIPLDAFEHYAFFNEAESRIEMHLVAQRDLEFYLGADELITFETGEHMITEYSYKYTETSFRSLVEKAGYTLEHTWQDPDKWFAVHYCTAKR